MKTVLKRPTQTSRADLLYQLDRYGEDRLKSTAALFAYQLPDAEPEYKPRLVPQSLPTTASAVPAAPETKIENASTAPEDLRYYIHQHQHTPKPVSNAQAPEWYQTNYSAELEKLWQQHRQHQPPQQQPLIPWHRLWPYLYQRLSDWQRLKRLDNKQLNRQLAQAKPLLKLPYQQRRIWARSTHIIIENNQRLALFHHDFVTTVAKLIQQRGQQGLIVSWIHHPRELLQQTLPHTERVLIFSDLGLHDENNSKLRHYWRSLGRQWRQKGVVAQALLPCASSQYDDSLKDFQLAYWDRGAVLQSSRSKPPTQTTSASLLHLLSLISACVRVEPALLRALRYLLPIHSVSVETEMQVWQHQHAQAYLGGVALNPQHSVNYRQHLLKHPLKQQVIACLKAYHGHLSPAILAEELTYCHQRDTVYDAYLADIVQRLQDAPATSSLRHWAQRNINRHDPSSWAKDTFMTNAWRILGGGQVPEGLDVSQTHWQTEAKSLYLQQQGKQLFCCSERKQGCVLLASLSPSQPYWHWAYVADERSLPEQTNRLGEQQTLEIAPKKTLYIQTDQDQLWLSSNPPFHISAPQQFEAQDDGTVYDPRTGLLWQTNVTQGDWYEANTKAPKGWRLPTRLELVTLVDYQKHDPAIDERVFIDTPSESFWCQESVAWDDSQAWQVTFDYGWSSRSQKSQKAEIRWVSGGRVIPQPRFENLDDTMVRDNFTGLIWSRYYCDKTGYCAEGIAEGMRWEMAKQAAQSCRLKGESWQLPTQIELLSLVDLSRAKPALDTDFFVSGSSDWVCSATPWAGAGGVAWFVRFGYGYDYDYYAYKAWRVRLVRGGQ